MVFQITTTGPQWAVVTPMTRTIADRTTIRFHFAVLRDLGIPVTMGPWICDRMIAQYSANH